MSPLFTEITKYVETLLGVSLPSYLLLKGSKRKVAAAIALLLLLLRFFRQRGVEQERKAEIHPVKSNGITSTGDKSSSFEGLEYLSDAYIGGGQVSCFNYAVIVDGKTVHQNSKGVQSLESNVAASSKTIFRIASMTKPLTSTAAMILIERGLLELDQEISVYLPELSNLRVYVSGDSLKTLVTREAARQVTLRDLMTHRGGFTYGLFESHAVDKMYQELFTSGFSRLSEKAFLENVAKLPLLFDPGTHFTYSIGTDLLGLLIGRVAQKNYGLGYRDFLRKELLDPLEMEDTDFYLPPEKLTRLANQYMTGQDKGFGMVDVNSNPFFKAATEMPLLCSAGGGMYSTIDDYQNFMKMLIAYGEYKSQSTGKSIRILSKQSVKTMTEYNNLELITGGGGKRSDVPAVHLDKEGYKDYAFHQGMGWNLAGWMIVDKERAPGSEHSELGEYGWSGYLGVWFCIAHVKMDGKTHGVGLTYFTQTLPEKGLPLISQFRWVGMKSVRHYLSSKAN